MSVQSTSRPLSSSTTERLRPVPPPDISIAIGRDNYGNIYAGNRFNTYVGSVMGDMITLAADGEVPLAVPRERPVDGRPRDFAELLGREIAVGRAGAAVSDGEPVEFYAAPGLGKTSLLRYLAWRIRTPPDGIYHVRAAARPLEDLQHKLFTGFFTSQFPIKQYRDQLLEHLRDLRALIIIDDVSYSRDELGDLLNAMPRCQFVLASEARRLFGEGQSVPLPGLPTVDGVTLFARTLGRTLTAKERALVTQFVEAREGKPLAIIQAAAAVAEKGGDLSAVLVGNPTIAKEPVVVERLIGAMPDPEQRALGVLAALPAVPMLPENVAALSGLRVAIDELDSLIAKGLAEQTPDGLYRLVRDVAAETVPATLVPGMDAVLDRYLAWGGDNRTTDRLGQEWEALEQLLQYATDTGRHEQALALAQLLDGPLTLDGQWRTWDRVMDRALDAAQAGGLAREEAWVLHQQGTRAMLRLDAEASRPKLEEALRMRSAMGAEMDAKLTQYHLDLWRWLFVPVTPAPPTDGGKPGGFGRLLRIGGLLLLGAVGLLAAFLIGGAMLGRDDDPPPPTPTALVAQATSTAPVGVAVEPVGDLRPRILSPPPDSVVEPGEEIWFEADVDGQPLDNFDGHVSWLIDDRTISNEPAFSGAIPPAMAAGFHTVIVLLEGADGRVAEATVPLRIDSAPELLILRPAESLELPAGQRVLFLAEAVDPEDGDLSPRIVWESSSDGQFGLGPDAVLVPPTGEQLITVWVEDSAGNYVDRTLSLVVVEEAQTVPPPAVRTPVLELVALEILDPTAEGAVVLLAAVAEDPEEGDLSDQIVWRSSLSRAPLGRGPQLQVGLPPGLHQIMATVSNSAGESASAEGLLVVERPVSPNMAPELAILSPQLGATVNAGEPVQLAANATDVEDGSLNDAIVWRLRDGELIGEGGLTSIDLPPGAYRIVAQVTDSAGATATANTFVTVAEGLADLVGALEQSGEVRAVDNGVIEIPVVLSFANVGTAPAGPFKVSADLLAGASPVPVRLVEFARSDGFYVYTDSVLEPGQSVALEGFVLLLDPDPAWFGEQVDLRLWVDSCAGEQLVTDACRIAESDERNNYSFTPVTLPPLQ